MLAPAGDSAKVINGYWPARYGEVLTVTAMVDTDGVPGGFGTGCSSPDDSAATSFSNFVNYPIANYEVYHYVAAPGACITSTWLNNTLATQTGTRPAMAHVAGAVALCFGNVVTGAGPCAALTPAQVVAKFVQDAAANAAAGRGFKFDRAGNELGSQNYGDLIDVAAF